MVIDYWTSDDYGNGYFSFLEMSLPTEIKNISRTVSDFACCFADPFKSGSVRKDRCSVYPKQNLNVLRLPAQQNADVTINHDGCWYHEGERGWLRGMVDGNIGRGRVRGRGTEQWRIGATERQTGDSSRVDTHRVHLPVYINVNTYIINHTVYYDDTAAWCRWYGVRQPDAYRYKSQA